MNEKAAVQRRIHWLSWQPTPYNDFLFQHISADAAVDLNVHYRSKMVSSHPWQSNLGAGYKARYYDCTLGVDWHIVLLAFKDSPAFFLIAGWDHPTSQVLLTLLRTFRRTYAVWTDTPEPVRSRKSLRACLRFIWLRWIFSGAARVFGTGSPGVRNLEQLGAPVDRLVDLPFVLDLHAYTRAIEPVSYGKERPLRLISSGRINNRLKGHDVAVSALALASARSTVPFEYCIAGAGPDQAELLALVRGLGLEGKVRCLGWVEPDRLRQLYLGADVLIHPSPTHDPFPNAVLEGMAAGMVVLASDVSGSALDRIQHGVNGFIHVAGDVVGLAEQIVYLLEHLEEIPRIGLRARATAELWPVERAVSTILEVVCHAELSVGNV